MNYKTYKLTQEEKLKDIAIKFETTEAEIKRLNPNMQLIKMLFSDAVVAYNEEIVVPLSNEELLKTKLKDTALINELLVSGIHKYRVEQQNTTRMEDEVTSLSVQKKEYTVAFNKDKSAVKVELVDHFYDITPKVMQSAFEFVSKTEFIRNDVLIALDSDGRFDKILNKDTQKEQWLSFMDKEANDIEFIKTLKKDFPDEYNQLLEQGKLQYASPTYDAKDDFNRDVFYLVLLDKYLQNKELLSEMYISQSSLFRGLPVPMEIRYDVIKEDDKTITIRKVWEVIMSDQLLENVTRGYEEYFQPIIKYKFSEYKISMRCLFTYSKEDKVLQNADFTILEAVENNIKSECKVKIKLLKQDESIE